MQFNRRPEILLLENGLRLVYVARNSAAEYFGISVDSGSRDESEGLFGLAHFVEHTIFKGTSKRKAHHIINRMESIGGELNAFTSKEETNIYTVFPKGNLSRAVELVADLVTDSCFPSKELEKEKDVVLEEIDSYLDAPSESVFDNFEDLIFKGSSLGHNILGTPDSITNFDSSICREYLKSNFWTGRSVVYYMGGDSLNNVKKYVSRFFSAYRRSGNASSRIVPAVLPTFEEIQKLSTHQCHNVMGARIPGIENPLKDAVALTCNILGGPGMNSRLNVELRERRGLVYAVDAGTTIFSDSGLFNIYFGCDSGSRDKCMELINKQLSAFADNILSHSQLEAAKKQYIGQLTVASENAEQFILSAGRAVALNGKLRTLEEIVGSVHSITPQEIAEVAQLIRPEKMSILSMG